jgi:hypothetical protein
MRVRMETALRATSCNNERTHIQIRDWRHEVRADGNSPAGYFM